MIQVKYETGCTALFVGFPGMGRGGVNAEQALETLKHGNSGGRPPRNPRGTKTLLYSLAGMVVGCITGGIIGYSMSGAGTAVTGAILGFVVGGIAGSFIGEYLKKRRDRKLALLAKEPNRNDNRGPILR